MSTIYDLTQEQKELLDILYFEEDDELIQHRLMQVQGEIKRKLSWLTTVLSEARAENEADEARHKYITEKSDKKRKRSANAVNRVKKYILESMIEAGIKRIDGDVISLSLCDNKRPAYEDNANFEVWPEDCFKVIHEIKPVSAAIKKHLLAGEELPGAVLVNEPYLREV